MDNITLSDCIYEHIKDTFYYGIFGDFKLVIDKSTGCFNATKLCDLSGKNLFHWKRLEKSKRLVEYYQKSRPPHVEAGFLYEVKGDNNDKLNKQFTGTYVPKELILDIASWVSIEFYDKCNNIIINYFVKEFKKMDNKNLKKKIKEVDELTKTMKKLTLENEEKSKGLVEKDDKIDELKQLILKQDREREKDREYLRSLGISLEEVKDQNDELLDRNKGLKKDVKDVKRKLGIAVEDRAPLPKDKGKQERFVLLKRNDKEHFQYYIIRAQNSYTIRKIKLQRTLFPDLEILLDFKAQPNSKTLYVRIKDELREQGVVFYGNNIDLEGSDVTEEELKEAMKVINDSKREI